MDLSNYQAVEIPLPQAAWFTSDWGYRLETKKPDFRNVGQFSLGFGTVPPNTHSEVFVEDIRFLKQSDTELVNPEIHLGMTSAICLRGTVKTGEQILFDANDSAANLVTVYDGNWNFLRTLPVEIMGTFQVPQNQPVHVSVGSEDHASDGCWFEIRLTTTGSPILVPKTPKP